MGRTRTLSKQGIGIHIYHNGDGFHLLDGLVPNHGGEETIRLILPEETPCLESERLFFGLFLIQWKRFVLF